MMAPDQFFFLLELFLRQLRVYYFMAPSLTRGRVCNLLLLIGLTNAVPLGSEFHWYTRPYFIAPIFGNPLIWRAKFPYLYPLRIGWLSYTPGHWILDSCSAWYTKFINTLLTQNIFLSHTASNSGYPNCCGPSNCRPETTYIIEVEVDVTLWLTVSQSVCLGVRHPFGAHDQILLFTFFYLKIAFFFVLERPLWRDDRSAICSAICQWSESPRTHNHTLLSHLIVLGFLSVASYD
jgi:hypothetical protein